MSTALELAAEAERLREDAEIVVSRLYAEIDVTKVGKQAELFWRVAQSRPVGESMVALGMLIAELSRQSPDPDLFKAMLIVVTARAEATRPHDGAVH